MWRGGSTTRPFTLTTGQGKHLVWAKRGGLNRTSLKWQNPASLLPPHTSQGIFSALCRSLLSLVRSKRTSIGLFLSFFSLTTLWPGRLVHLGGDGRGCQGWRGPGPAWPSGRSWPCSFRAALQGGASSCASPAGWTPRCVLLQS